MAEPAWWIAPTQTWTPSGVTGSGTGAVPDWDELADMDQPGSGSDYARDDGKATLCAHIPFEKLYDARKKILGYAYADTGSPWALHRVNPLQHPDEPQLRATSMSYTGMNPLAGLIPLSSPSAYGAYVDAEVASTFPKRVRYTRAKVSVNFRPHNYPFMSDADMVAGGLSEIFRHVAVFDSTDPALQVLAAGSEPFMKWIDTPAAGADPQPIVGGQPNTTGLDKGELSILISQANFVMVWHHVPYDYIASPYLPSKILNCMGKVNNATWLSTFPAGTLKLEAPRIKRSVQSHIRTTGGIIPFVCDIFLPFTWVDPTPGALSGGAAPTMRGWNLFAWNKTAKFYSIVRKDNPTVGLFETANFDSIFTHVLS
jgi:hypothetical protein